MSDASLPTLTLQAYLDQACNKKNGDGWIIPYLPGSLKLAFSNEQKEVKVLGSTSKVAYQGTSAATLTVTLLLYRVYYDDWNSFKSGKGRAVKDQLKLLYSSLYQVNGDTHQPSFVTVDWGEDLLLPYAGKKFRGVLTRVDASEQHNDGNGIPTYIKVDCAFTEIPPDVDAKKNSPDLTHYRKVVAGDRLDYKTWQIYGDGSLASQVARSNDLDSPRLIQPGQTLSFPPFSTSVEAAT
ncbi:CIS tube protein [Chromobacterium subtsugae]|uniref:CIS tube protein n=1 Tax=Chromobacterium subtsugae TaxID=251747 RepID=UPI00069BBDAB|nr:hypothetical protein [Chromobacterium subtsugae]